MDALTPPGKGFRSLLKWIRNDLIAAVNARTPLRSPTCEIHEHPSGAQIQPRAKGGGGVGDDRLLPFELVIVPENATSNSIRVVASTLGGQIPTGMFPQDNPIFKMTGITGNGVVFAQVTFVMRTGVITGRQIKKSTTLPPDTDTTANFPFGYWATVDRALTVNNTAFGPISAAACRDYFVSPAKYSIRFGAAGMIIYVPPPEAP